MEKIRENHPLTRHGVCYDLNQTPFISYWGHYVFYFSSLKHKKSFESKLQVRIPWLNDSLSRRFKMKVDASAIAVFQLYRQVETRGFLVKVIDCCSKGVNKIWHSADEVQFDGLKVSWKDSTVREETITDGSEQLGSETDTKAMLLP